MSTQGSNAVKGIVTKTERLINSKDGNPRYRVEVKTDDGEIWTFQTSADSHVGLSIQNSEYRESNHIFVLDHDQQIVEVR